MVDSLGSVVRSYEWVLVQFGDDLQPEKHDLGKTLLAIAWHTIDNRMDTFTCNSSENKVQTLPEKKNECGEHDHPLVQKHNENSTERSYAYNPEDIELHKKEVLSAVDLTITKTTDHQTSPRGYAKLNKRKKQSDSIGQLLENFSCHNSCTNKYLCTKSIVENTKNPEEVDYSVANCEIYEDNCSSIVATDYSLNKKSSPKMDTNNQTLWSTVANVCPYILQIDKESQTLKTDTKDVSVQTDVEPKILSYTICKNDNEANPQYVCTICKHLYTTKSSYGRHLKTHVKNSTRKIFTNIQFTTEAKLQVCKKQVPKKPIRQVHKPIIIQMQRTTYIQCDFCQTFFSTQTEKNEHDCIIEQFPMTKCPECEFKCYTLGALNDHITLVHKNVPSGNNFYYCIFCNESFDAGYNFHLHLNKHLSP